MSIFGSNKIIVTNGRLRFTSKNYSKCTKIDPNTLLHKKKNYKVKLIVAVRLGEFR